MFLRPDKWLFLWFREIQVYFTHTKKLLPNDPSGNLWIDVDNIRRVHYDWVTNVREVNPFTLSYHVLVHDADESDLNHPKLSCSPMKDLEKYQMANVYSEPTVIFKLQTVTIHRITLLSLPSLSHCEEYITGTDYFMQHIFTELTVFMTVDDLEILSLTTKTPNVSMTIPTLMLAFKYFIEFQESSVGI